jgi:5-methylcytosine-specific restriction endonuclease McrA
MPHDPFYWSRDWRRLRALVLRHIPDCQVPGCGERATEVDHRVPRSQGGASLDPRNLVAYCRPHHSMKTRGKTPYAKGCTADGTPRDPTHWWNR